MLKTGLGLMAILAFVASTSALSQHARPAKSLFPQLGENVGEALYFTELLKTKPVEFIRNASIVEGIINRVSYSGFFTVNETTSNNLYAWYFPAKNGNVKAPLLIWLQGGPGGSSFFGLFAELGPIYLDAQLNVHERPYSWNNEYAMIFIDNPVGAGFSYTEKDAGYATGKEDYARDLFNLLQQFYKVFPEQQPNDLYITGESYGGHYIPAISYKIHVENLNPEQGKFVIPLKGLAIGDGWIDPVLQLQGYPDLFFNLGLADLAQRERIQQYIDDSTHAIVQERWLDAFNPWDEFLNGDVYPYHSYFYNITGSTNYDNFQMSVAPPEFSYYPQYLNQAIIRNALHVGSHPFNDGHACEMHLLADFMKSLKPELTVLMDHYKVLIYSGQLDVIIAPALTELFLPTVQWQFQREFSHADRFIWKVDPADTEVAGFVKTYKDFSYILVRSAGHILPFDQPRVASDMITRFVEGRSFRV